MNALLASVWLLAIGYWLLAGQCGSRIRALGKSLRRDVGHGHRAFGAVLSGQHPVHG